MSKVDALLSKEEHDVLVMVAVHPGLKHLSNSEIGQRLGIPVTRVKTIIHQACQKLGADNRNEAVLLAIRLGEIDLTELLSLEELAEILSSLDPGILRQIAEMVRRNHMRKYYPMQSQQIMPAERRPAGILTNRERDVLILASHGLTNVEIAEKLYMTSSAVRTFLNRAFKKLGARKKADAVQLALKLKEISVEEISSVDELTFYLAPFGAESIEKMSQILEGRQGGPEED